MHSVNIILDRRGVTSIEYALVMGLLAVSLVAVLQLSQSKLISTMMQIAGALPEYSDTLTVPGNPAP